MTPETPLEQAGGAPENPAPESLERLPLSKNPACVAWGKKGGRPRKGDPFNEHAAKQLFLDAYKDTLSWFADQLGPAGKPLPSAYWLAATAKLTGFSDREILKGLWLRELPKQTQPNTPCTTTP